MILERKGVQQEYILSSCLFNLYTEYIMQNDGLDDTHTQAGIKIAKRNKNNLRYANQFSSVQSLSRVRLFVTPWTVAYQAPPSMEFSRQEYQSGLPFPSPGDLPEPESFETLVKILFF